MSRRDGLGVLKIVNIVFGKSLAKTKYGSLDQAHSGTVCEVLTNKTVCAVLTNGI